MTKKSAGFICDHFGLLMKTIKSTQNGLCDILGGFLADYSIINFDDNNPRYELRNAIDMVRYGTGLEKR